MNAVYLGDKPTKTTPLVNADEIPILDSQDLSSGRKKVKKATFENLKASVLAGQPKVYAAYVNFFPNESPVIENEVFNDAFNEVEITKDDALTGVYYLNFTNSVTASKVLLPAKTAIIDENDTLCSLFYSLESQRITIACKDANGGNYDLLQGSFSIKVEIYP